MCVSVCLSVCLYAQLNRYKVALIKPSTRALHISSKVSLRVDTRGFLSLQYMIKNEDGNVCFVEYLVCTCACTVNTWFKRPPHGASKSGR